MTTSMLILLAIGLAMDAFAVSVTNGMCYRIPLLKNALASGLAFGIFQGMMPLIGYLAGYAFHDTITAVEHWVALLLLGFIGGKMILSAIRQQCHPQASPPFKVFSLRTLMLQAVATSIDALSVGVGLGVMNVNVLVAVGVISLVTFLCCVSGVVIGKHVGTFFQDKAELLGGVILILIGARIFMEHYGIL